MGQVPVAAPNPDNTANPNPANPANPGSTITLVCRAVNLSSVDSAANTDIAYTVLKAFQEDPLFDPKTTQLRGDITPDDATRHVYVWHHRGVAKSTQLVTMAWIKRNLFFVVGGILAIGLLGAAGFYNYKGWSHNTAAFDKLNEIYSNVAGFASKKPSPGNDKVNNIEAAKDQERQLAGLDPAGREIIFSRLPRFPTRAPMPFRARRSPLRSAGPLTRCNMKPRPPA